MLPLLLPLATLQAPPAPVPKLPEVDAKSLPGVPGPLVPHYPDPARSLGRPGLNATLRYQARHGVNIPAVALPPGSLQLSDHIGDISGWKAYRIEVPAHGGFKARLHSGHDAWFLVKVFNRWGRMEEGMLQNRIYRGIPEATYQNPDGRPHTVFIVVDTTENDLMGEAFTLTITRN